MDYMPGCKKCINMTNCIECYPGNGMTLISGKCVFCSQLMEYCQSCQSQTQCTRCFNGFAVIGGCSTDSGCLEVAQTTLNFQLSSYCIRCNEPEYYIDNSTHTCHCTIGFKAGYFCTTVTGCINTVKVAGKV